MSIDTQAMLVLAIAAALYVVLSVVLLRRGRMTAAGLVMFACACLPLAWQVIFTRSQAPGFALFLIVMGAPALLLAAVGVLRRYRRRNGFPPPR